MHHEQHLGEAGRCEIRRVARRVISRRFYTASTDDGSSSDSDTNPPPSIPRLSRCGDRAHVDFLKIDIDLKWDSIGRGSRDIVNSSAWHVRGCVALAMGFPAHHPVAVAHAIALSTGRVQLQVEVLPSVAVAQASVALYRGTTLQLV